MRRLILASLLLLVSTASGQDWKQRYTPPTRPASPNWRNTHTQTYEYTNGDTTYGTYIGGGYVIQRIGPVTIINTYTAPTFGSGIQPRTQFYVPRNNSNLNPSR